MRYIRIFISGYSADYAVRLAKNCYVVTGGAIKLTLDMKRNHLKKEPRKLEQTSGFLRDNDINYPEDLSIYPYE
ncbi:MAG: hypothetical protein ACHQD7_00020 [Chitinophagales bacterium]